MFYNIDESTRKITIARIVYARRDYEKLLKTRKRNRIIIPKLSVCKSLPVMGNDLHVFIV